MIRKKKNSWLLTLLQIVATSHWKLGNRELAQFVSCLPFNTWLASPNHYWRPLDYLSAREPRWVRMKWPSSGVCQAFEAPGWPVTSVTVQRVWCLRFHCVTSICVKATNVVGFHPATAGSSRCAHHVCTGISSECHVSPPPPSSDSLTFTAACKPLATNPTSHTPHLQQHYNSTVPTAS